MVPRGAHQWRVGGYLVEEMMAELRRRGVRYEAGRAMLPQRLAHQVLLRMEASGDSPDDRVQNAVARSRPVRAYTDAVWPALDPTKLILRLLTDSEFLATSARGHPDRRGAGHHLDDQTGQIGSGGQVDAGGRDLIDEVADLLNRTPSLGHVIVDEAQDLSPMQLVRGGPPGDDRLCHRAR